MVMHPQSCKVLAETIEYANTLKTLRLLLKALRRADGYNLPSEAEKKLVDPLEIAELKIDLRKLKSAKELLRGIELDENGTNRKKYERAQFLLGQLARRKKSWQEMEEHFTNLKSPYYKDQIHMERAYKFWKATIKSRPQDPWIYRADWACWSSKQKPQQFGVLIGTGPGTPLGRIAYLIWQNPDLGAGFPGGFRSP